MSDISMTPMNATVDAIKELRQFYDENGYLPHKAAERLIGTAEALLAERKRHVEALEFLRDYTYVDAEGPELRSQNERCHRMAKEALTPKTEAIHE